MGAYYYAAGRKVAIEPDDAHVAVDMTAAAKSGADKQVVSAGAANKVGGMIIAERSAFDDETLTSLRRTLDRWAVHPNHETPPRSRNLRARSDLIRPMSGDRP